MFEEGFKNKKVKNPVELPTCQESNLCLGWGRWRQVPIETNNAAVLQYFPPTTLEEYHAKEKLTQE